MGQINYIDIIVFFLLVLDFFTGIKMGAIALVFDIISLIAGWFIARAAFLSFASFLIAKTTILHGISNLIAPLVKVPETLASLSATLENVHSAIISMGLPSFLGNFITKDFVVSTQTVSQFITDKLAVWVVNGISFIILFFIAMIVIRIAGYIVKKILRFSPFLKWVDVLFGGILKIVVSSIIIFIILSIIMSIFGFLNFQESSIIYHIKTSWFYTNLNLLFPSLKDTIIKMLAQINL
jgi:hypothetical protein